jgi:SH3-like domain-containing protein
VSWKVPILTCVVLTLTIPSLLAAETRYVHSESVPLNVRSGPSIDNSIVARLAHGTQVSLLERWSVWARVATSQGDEGWVLQRYLTPDPPLPSESQTDMSADEEQRRFTRLQSKGIITIQRGQAGVLKLTINALIWRHLTPHEQHNFLQRAQRLFGSTSVEIYDHHTDSLLARLTDMGTFESLADSASSQTTSPLPPPRSFSPLSPPVGPR